MTSLDEALRALEKELRVDALSDERRAGYETAEAVAFRYCANKISALLSSRQEVAQGPFDWPKGLLTFNPGVLVCAVFVPDGYRLVGDDFAAGIVKFHTTTRQEVAPVAGLERIDGMEFWLHENVDDSDAEPVRLVMAMSHNDKVFCHRASQGDNGICNDTSTGQTSDARDVVLDGEEEENFHGH